MRRQLAQSYARHVEQEREVDWRRQRYEDAREKDLRSQVERESEARADLRRRANVRRTAEREYNIAESLYQRGQQEKSNIERRIEMDSIARVLADQKDQELRDRKIRQGLRESCPELRDLQAKLNIAIANQERFYQVQNQERRRVLERNEELRQDQELIRRDKEAEQQQLEEENAKLYQRASERRQIQQQLIETERRKSLLEAAVRKADKEQMDANQRKEIEHWQRERQERHERQMQYRKDVEEFQRLKAQFKEMERIRDLEEKRKMDEFISNVDERLNRAKEEQKRLNAQREIIASEIGNRIRREQKEREDYEQLVIDLAAEEELRRLKQREEAEFQKIQRQHREAREYLTQYYAEKRRRAARDAAEAANIRRQQFEHEAEITRIAQIEQEKARLRVEQYRRELRKQVLDRKEMAEAARREELNNFRIQQEIEAQRQRLIEDERRNLVVGHILKYGPESIRFLPKGVLQERDLEYLPEEYQLFIMREYT